MKKIMFAAVIITAVSGCKTIEPQYYYGQYNNAVYSYFKAEDVTVEQQISVLQAVIDTAAAKNKAIAPGIHAHLGMLYFETGNNTLGVEHFEQEKRLFPESAHYINFLLNSGKEVQDASS
ncbi:DUF4810 domain-containing protein [Psychrobium sp. 1_MG-2023]|uniref:DUF4810 domain-containing protein n=1 Tax=Psychrobium sp. 1_MG-2023 TaxID=3062624 RepID=UPI000C31C68B|nr:DUF4810 domain-containing protein [Psychrobium sp. 1_MG-2023]MDP2561591.1 DUF4810 domain-containing protein [Psychrobium sp. 1_MG-2023]PKF55612.1 DUF4810 domain-containing protein [Alteromonadales bacterium alter-6D02]